MIRRLEELGGSYCCGCRGRIIIISSVAMGDIIDDGDVYNIHSVTFFYGFLNRHSYIHSFESA